MALFPFSVSRLRLSLSAGLTLAALAALASGCTTINLPAADGAASAGTPVVDASIRSEGNGEAGATTSPVAPEALDARNAAPLNGMFLQTGAFSSQANADRAADALRNQVPSLSAKVSVAPHGAHFRVLVGPFASERERLDARATLRSHASMEAINAAP